MPRAENRKKPTNQANGVKQGGFANKQSNGSNGGVFGQGNNKKQELIEKMKKQQAAKNNEA